MSSDKNIPRLLGAAFLFVLLASMTASALSVMTILSGSISESLINISNNLLQMRISILVELLTSIGIVVLASLLYTVLQKQNKIISLVALGFWLGEAAILAFSKVGAFALIPLSSEYVSAGSPASSYYQTLGTLFFGIDRWGYDIHFLFFGLGGLLWYCLFYRSKYIPRVIAGWGIIAVTVATIGILLGSFGVMKVNPLFILQNALFELTIGLWLLIKGIKNETETLENKDLEL